MDQYCILGRIGEGAHGIVFKAKHVETGEIVALKKVALRRLEDGIPNQALREIKALQEIEDNQHVVQLKAVFPHGAGFVLAFEFMLSDLAEVVRHAQRPLAQAQVKSYLQMLLRGVAFCHANNIVHRDLKPANLLISASGQLKIADFGLARVFSPDGSRLYTHQVATRWYRAPELLYGARQYDQGVDLWAVGCILGELLNGSPLFPGENDIEQLCCVLRILGTPSPQVWPEITELPDYNKISFKEQAPVPLEEVLPDASPQALDLLGQFLLYPPRQRISASQVWNEVSRTKELWRQLCLRRWSSCKSSQMTLGTQTWKQYYLCRSELEFRMESGRPEKDFICKAIAGHEGGIDELAYISTNECRFDGQEKSVVCTVSSDSTVRAWDVQEREPFSESRAICTRRAWLHSLSTFWSRPPAETTPLPPPTSTHSGCPVPESGLCSQQHCYRLSAFTPSCEANQHLAFPKVNLLFKKGLFIHFREHVSRRAEGEGISGRVPAERGACPGAQSQDP
ncbi:cyclin-dependent kinase 20 isoform X5 [Ailuropoda melanoleuca]|uniref:cyclin-dependent kinase 20 isoform X5 n=1 Tax=Ailuropoda melanoleuca TaxID=9646 RepID=UPI00149430BF|nr:cyclin-dependent kinase 20 isoform X5 [Ailuropoda melanoleuca]